MHAAGRTALGAARTRFIDELDERAQQLRNGALLLEREPHAFDVLRELERRLRSLHASAELCELWQLAGACVAVLAQLQAVVESRQDPSSLIVDVTGVADTLDAMSERASHTPLAAQSPHVAVGADGSELQLTQTVTGRRAPSQASATAPDVHTGANAAVDAIAARMAEEIRRGIAASLQAGRDEGVALGDPGELMQAAWSAVDRVRALVAERSAGRVRFDGEEEGSAKPAAPAALVLLGRTVLVADDDPAVLLFFAGLLRDAGAHVLEAKNGRDALALARALRPVLVISDILMPKLDGFTLCRELKRDLILSHVPVVLSSWKEDFLQRMRELEAGASGYVRKESGAAQVMQIVRDVLGPRLGLEAALRDRGQAEGRVQELGCLALIEIVAEGLRDARLQVHDSWNVFEVHISEGERLSVTRTASDGSFARGESALLQLLGVVSGGFEVHADASGPRGMGEMSLTRTLLLTAQRLGALMDAVSDARLLRVASVAFDDAVLPALLEATPTHVAYLVSQLRSGEMSAGELISTGQFPARELETQLLELARRGAIVSVRDEHGEDLVAQALSARELDMGAVLHASLPPPPAPVEEGEQAQAADEFGQRFSPEELRELTQSPAHAPFRAGALESAQLDAELDRVLSRPPPPLHPVRSDGQSPSKPRAALKALAKRRSVVAPAEPAPEPRRNLLGLFLTLALLMGIGYLGWLTLFLRAPLPGVGDGPSRAPIAAPQPPAAFEFEAALPPVEPKADVSASPTDEDDALTQGYGRALPFIDRSRGIEVATDEGLLVVEHEGRRGASPRIRVDTRDLGRAPIAAALAAGRHEIVIDRAGSLSYRYLVIRPGETRVVELSAGP